MGLFGLFKRKRSEFYFRGALFDLDGTLIDSEPWLRRAWRDVLSVRGCDERTFDRTRIVGLNGRDACAVVIEHFRLAEELDAFYDEWRTLARNYVFNNAGLCPGAKDAVAFMERNKVPKCVVTSSGSVYANRMLRKHGLREKVLLVTADDLPPEKGKPEPYPFLLGAERIGCEPADALVFEDAPLGVRGAKRAGMAVVGLSHGEPLMEDALRAAGANMVVPTLEDFMPFAPMLRRDVFVR